MTIKENTFEALMNEKYEIPEEAMPEYLEIIRIMAFRSLAMRVHPKHGDLAAITFGASPFWHEQYQRLETLGDQLGKKMGKGEGEWEGMKYPGLFGKGEQVNEACDEYLLPFQDEQMGGIIAGYINELHEFILTQKKQ